MSTVPCPSKPFWQSKTLWVNVIGLIIAVVQFAATKSMIGAEIEATVLSVLNIILRLITSQPIQGR